MPQIAVSSSNIAVFRFSVAFDIYAKTVTFDASLSTYLGSSGSGRLNLAGMSFSLEDQQGIQLAEISFTDSTKYIVPGTTQVFTLDLSSLPTPFFFQTYKIYGAVKDADGTITYTVPIYKKVCQPVNVTESGYVPGIFQITPNCIDNVLTVKELTLLTYNNLDPESTTKAGTLSYPTGTISAISFTGTPFSNNVIYTGEYRVNCETLCVYDLEDDVYVHVTYITNNVFPVTCANKIADLICCLVEIQKTYELNCNNAQGKYAQQQLNSVTMPFLVGLTKEINGQDASTEADLIKKTLNCDCGATSSRQNEFSPINPSATNIVLTGVGGTTIPSPTVNGNTKTYLIGSKIYQVVKGNSGDLAFTIAVDTATANTVKYVITFNYTVMASYILNAISDNPTLVTQLNSLITATGQVDLTGLDMSCVLTTQTNLFLTQAITGATKIETISTATQDYDAPANLFASSASSVQSWLNGLGLGTFSVNVSGGIFSVLSLNNTRNITSLEFSNPDLTVPFQRTNLTLVTALQAIVDYLCDLTSLQVLLGNTLYLCALDYNGERVETSFTANQSQWVLNQGIASALCNIVDWVSTLTGITCAKLQAVFQDYPSGAFGANDRIYGTLDGNCAGLTGKQVATLVISAINANSDVKEAFCAIDCTTPGACPEVTGINIAALSANSVGIYGVTWDTNPIAAQTATVRYKRNNTDVWTTATNSLGLFANGNVSGTSPYEIAGLTAGVTYDIWVLNNCGGEGFVTQILTPTGTAYPASYIRGNVLYLLCAGTPVTLYTSQPFAIGVILYTNVGMSTPLTGYAYVVANNTIYTVNTSTGEVLTDTGSSCENGTENVVALGNNTGTICGAEITEGYTNGVFAVGGILYSDSALTTPVTGYSYVVNTANNTIYGLNSVSGVIMASTGLTCAAYSGSYQRDNSEGTICASSVVTLYSADPFAPGVTVYTNLALTTPLTGYQFIANADGIIYSINSVSGSVSAATGNTCA